MRNAIGGLLVLAAAACSGSDQPCSSYCAPIAGRYQLALGDGTISQDCAAVGASPDGGVLEIAQASSALTGTFGTASLSGTLYQSLRFTLEGDELSPAGRQETTTLRGQYAPLPADAGSGGLLSGTYELFVNQPGPGGTRTCAIDLAFDAQPL